MPGWVELLQAARFLGVPPWDLAERPVAWTRWALIVADAEARARQAQAERAARR